MSLRLCYTVLAGGALLAAATDVRAQRPTHELVGRVVDTAGTPLAEVRVRLVELGRGGVTGADGRFRFAAVPAGAYTVSLSRLGRAPETRRVRVPGEPLAVTLRATRVQLAAVQVTASTGATRA